MRAGDFWNVPILWPESTVFIIGGGPSLLQQDLTLLHDKRVIGVNQAFRLGPWVDVCWFGDKQWYSQNLPDIKEYGGLIVTCSVEAQANKRLKRVKYLGRSKQKGIEIKRRTHIAWNGNSGASAVNLAYWLGAKRVVLLGFDMKNPEDPKDMQSHWHNHYEPKIDKRTRKLIDPYPRFMKGWPVIKIDADRAGLEIINATPNSALTLFEYRSLEEICLDI